MIYIWTGHCQKQPGYVNYFRVMPYFFIRWASNSWSIWYHILLIYSILTLGTSMFSNPLPLTVRTGVGILACIFYFFWNFSYHAYAIFLIPIFFISVTLVSYNERHSTKNISFELWGQELLLYSSRLTSLLASKMSSTYIGLGNEFLIL